MTDGLFGMSREEILESLSALRDNGSGPSGFAKLSALIERVVGPRPSSPRAAGPTPPARPSDQARDDAVQHRTLLSTYAQQVQGFLDGWALPTAQPQPQRRVSQTLVVLQPHDEASLFARFPVANDHASERSVTFRCDDETTRVAPAHFVLGGREARTVRVTVPSTTVVPFTITIMMDGRVSGFASVTDVAGSSVGPGAGPLIDLPKPDDDLDELLRRGQLAIIKHPLAAQALFRMFVTEGRRFATTEEGSQWKARLSGSELTRRGRVVWEVLSQKVLEEDSNTMLPTKLLDAFVKAVEAEGLEPSLAEQMGFALDDEDPTYPTSR